MQKYTIWDRNRPDHDFQNRTEPDRIEMKNPVYRTEPNRNRIFKEAFYSLPDLYRIFEKFKWSLAKLSIGSLEYSISSS